MTDEQTPGEWQEWPGLAPLMAVDKQIGQILDVLDLDRNGTGSALNDAVILCTSGHGERVEPKAFDRVQWSAVG